MLGGLKATHPNLHWFLPINNSLPYLDQNLQPVAVAPHANLGSRLVDVVANTSKVVTAERHIVEQCIVGNFDLKMAGNFSPIAHQLTEASGTPPTPDLPKIAIWLDVMAVIRRLRKPYRLRYGLAPGVTYADHGRDLLYRLTKENALCSTKGLGYARQNPFALVTNRELQNGTVKIGNLLDPDFTELPMLTREELMGITLGPLSVDSSMGYMTGYQEEDVLAMQQGNYQDPDAYHQQASQVCTHSTSSYCVTGSDGAPPSSGFLVLRIGCMSSLLSVIKRG